MFSRINTIKKELKCADIIQTFIRQGSKQEKNSRFGLPNKTISQSKPKSQTKAKKPKSNENNKIGL